MGKGIDKSKENNHIDYKLKNYNSLDMVGKLTVVRDVRREVIDIVYYNLLRSFKSSFKSDSLRKGKDKVDTITYSIIAGDYTLNIPLYNTNILTLKYSDNVERLCMPISVEPLKKSIYEDLEQYEGVLDRGVKLKDFVGVYGGGKIRGFFIVLFNKRKAISHIETRVERLKKVISNHEDDKKLYDAKYEAYTNRIDANVNFLSSISEDILYLKSKGFEIDIML